MTFHDYLMEQRERDDGIGDLARDYADDEIRVDSARELRAHLLESHPLACDGALRAVDAAAADWAESGGF